MNDLKSLLAASIKIKELEKQNSSLFEALCVVIECEDCVVCDSCYDRSVETLELCQSEKKEE